MKASVPLFLLLLAACGNQGVGERCDKLNLDLDCDDGLTCQTGFVSSGAMYGLCCPIAGPGVTIPSVCLVQQMGTNTPTGDGGSASEASSDSGAATETGASSEASADTGVAE